jgi:MinD-like ATPase involved in chromosome partitioning or flagellar assembly
MGLLEKLQGKAPDMGRALRDLAINLLTHGAKSGEKAYVVTGVSTGCGKTSVSIGLARTIAGLGSRVLLVESSPGPSVLSERLGLGRASGVSEYLGGRPLGELIVEKEKNFYALSDGRRYDQLFSVKEMEELYAACKEDHDIVLVDSVNLTSPAFQIYPSMDGVILVVNGESDRQEKIISSIRDLQESGAHVAGLILNRHRQFIPDCLMQALGLD